ncbi:MAG TPA: sugar phosphate nucleotidyltransferase [Pyrinomonadaceae bacterium]|jgi:NDP-sugar pyrophosphorylase family protein
MSAIKHALIMAAGRGQRMMPLTKELPKPMAPYNGSTLIAQGIAQIARRVEKVHITVGYKKAMLAQHVIEYGASSVINTEGEGNSWWIYNTLFKYLNEPVCVLTCDNVVDIDIDLLEEDYLKLGEPACMLVPVLPVAGLAGDYIFHKNHVVTDLDRHTPSEIYCSGIQILNPCKINELTEEADDFYSVWRQLIALEQLYVSAIYPKKWFAVDTVEQLAMLNSMYR